MFQPQAHSVLWFLAGFLGVWGVSLILRGLLRRTRHGVPCCPGCQAEIPPPGEGEPPRMVCPACRYEARSRKDFWPRRVHRVAVVGGSLVLVVAAGVFVAGYVVADSVRQADPSMIIEAANYGLGVGVLSLMGWALWGTPARGKKRCPRCWYDMAAVAESGRLVCPECGHDAGSHRELLRRRRRMRLFWSLTPVLLALLAMPNVLTMVRRGPAAGIPTPVLIAGMWWLPEEWVTGHPPGIFGGITDGSLVTRFGTRPRLAAWQREWAMSKVRAQLRNPTNPKALRRAAELCVYDEDRLGVYADVLESVFATAGSADQEHAALRLEFVPQLAMWASQDGWTRGGTEGGPLHRALVAHRDELLGLLARKDANANLFARLVVGLRQDAGPAVPLLEAALADPPVGLNRASALDALWWVAAECPEASAALVRALSSADGASVLAVLGGWNYQPTGSVLEAKLAELSAAADPQLAGEAIRVLASNEEWWTSNAARIRGLASSPGPQREAALRGLTVSRVWVQAADGLPELLESAAEDPDARVRLVVLEACSGWAVQIPSLRALVRRMMEDADPRVSQSARRVNAAMP